ncbi:DMT family transporter [Plantactinospora siamensis]|uniref:DMT family transporter n=1 Tax=Plantactinospora siamensis TaxID=555372 RepID=A0ABV6NVB2_9ACTN
MDPGTAGAVAVALLAISSSGPLIAYAAAPALAVAFWRNAGATVLLTPVSLIRRRAELVGLFARAGRRTGWYAVLAGVALAAHFAAWTPSTKLTSVAASTALVTSQPVWQGLIALGQGRRLSALSWLGIGLAVAGAVLTTGADLGGGSGRAVLGDVLALLGGMAAAVYTAFGERVRSTASTTTYTTVCYGVCSVLLLAVCLAGGVRLTGFNPATWLAILALVFGPQLLGHSLLNYALQRISATTISVLILLETPGAALIAWLWLGQTPRTAALPGLLLLMAGVAVVVLGNARTPRRPAPVSAPPETAPLRK